MGRNGRCRSWPEGGGGISVGRGVTFFRITTGVGGGVGEADGSKIKGEEDRSGEEVTKEGSSGIGSRRKGEDDRSERGVVREGEEGGDKIGSMTILHAEIVNGNTRGYQEAGTKQ